MKIKLDDRHYLNSDGHRNYWISTEFKTKNGKVSERRVSGYSHTLEKAVESSLERKISESDISSLEELKTLISENRRLIEGWSNSIDCVGK